MKIAQEVLEVLDRAEVDGKTLKLTGQLDRKLYANVNKVLEAIGGKWSRGAKAHVFDDLVVDVLDPIMETGEYSRTKQDFGQFDSPEDVVARVIQLAGIEPGMRVLEPSAGLGNIAAAARKAGAEVMCIESDTKRVEHLKLLGFGAIIQADFLQTDLSPTNDAVVMNPPFAKQADIDHVLHAAKFVKPGGRLVAVMSAGVMFRENRKTADFRAFVDAHGGTIEKLPDSSFVASGTQVNTCVVAFAV